MCLQSFLILNLSDEQKSLLRSKVHGSYFGTSTARIAVIGSLVSLNLVQRAGYHPKYGSPRWKMTRCGRNAGRLLTEIEARPVFAEMIKNNYDEIHARSCNLRSNPLLTKTKKKSFLGEVPLLEATKEDFEENMVIMGPMGPTGEFFGYHRETRILYFLIDSGDMQFFIDVILGEHPNEKLSPPIFALRRAIGGPGTIDMFWKNRATKPLIKKMAGAVQFIVDEGDVIITHMSTKRGWRRRKVNSAMIKYIENRYPDKKLFYQELTEQGRKFMESYGGEEWKWESESE